MNSTDLKKRTKEFAKDCVRLALTLPNTYLGNHFKGQIIRAATSIACNYRAVCHAHSKAGFLSKLSIVIEESDETEFWLEFIKEEELVKDQSINSLIKEANELSSIFIASRRTARKRENKSVK